jgi:hypothetical protein
MSGHADPAWDAAPARLYLHRAADEVDTVMAELPGTQLSPEVREEFASVVTELMGKLERLLSMLLPPGRPP